MSQAETESAGAEDPTPAEPTQTSGSEPTARLKTGRAVVVLALVLGLYALIAGFLMTGAALTVPDVPATWWIAGPVYLALAGLLFWGGAATARGRPNGFLVPTAIVGALAIVVSAVIKVIEGEVPLELVVLLLYGALAYLVARSGGSGTGWASARTR